MVRRLTLAHVFYLSTAALVLLLGGLLYVLDAGSRRAIGESAMRLRDSAAERAATRIEAYLDQADQAVGTLADRLRKGGCSARDQDSIESCLFATAAENPNLAEVTFTRATRLGFAPGGEPRLAPDGRWQVSVFRDREGAAAQLCTRRTEPAAGTFVAALRCRDPAHALLPAPDERPLGAVPDPTSHPTFVTPASRDSSGQLLRSDLSYSELDLELPPAQRRIVVTVLKAIEDPAGHLVGVVRVGLLAGQIAREVHSIKVNPEPDDPYRVFVCDDGGRLVALDPADPIAPSGDDLRVVAAHLPPVIARALADPALRRASGSASPAEGSFSAGGQPYAVAFRLLPRTQNWYIGVVGPVNYYLSALRGTVAHLIWVTGAVIAIVIAGGVLTLRALRRGLAQITRETERMRGFDFAPAAPRTPFGDVAAVLGSVEQAKTAMRAMRKYVPVEVVRYCFESNHEPTLGGRLAEVSLMFTDIRDFTTLAEGIGPDELALLLGHYLGAMTAAVHDADGTVDKYVGDAVMAMWNAPRACADHAIHACRAALACDARTAELYASPAWKGRPRLVTRYGLHEAEVMVGHFGAPDRFNYTAIGDGVNLAARLEGLNKQYGTTILASATIERDARGHFAFRRVDRVAVKGKSIAIEVYELLGELGQVPADRLAVARRYEQALEAYFARDFTRARELLGDPGDDGPSRVLAERCRVLAVAPPPDDWDGTYLAHEK